MDANEKADEIEAWLSRISKTGNSTNTSQFERSKFHQVDEIQARDDRNLERVLEAITETNAEYEAYIKDIERSLDELDLNPNGVSAELRDNIRKVALIRKSLGLIDLDEAALVARMNQGRIQLSKKARTERRLKLKYNEINQKRAIVGRKIDRTRRAVESTKEAIVLERNERTKDTTDDKLLAAKTTEYEKLANLKRSEIEDMELRELGPDLLLEKHKLVLEMEERLSGLNRDLLPYGELPPNLLQAKAILERKETEYSLLSQQLSRVDL